MSSPRKKIEYVPLPKASKKWSICVSFPHMKDAYWLGVDYGVVEESKRLGVKMQLVEAGGCTELKKQISHVRLSVGRQQMVEAVQALCFLAGANSIFYGDKLLTTGNADLERDRALMDKLGISAQSRTAG